MEKRADLVLVNGNIITVDKAFSTVESVAVADGKIIGVGSTTDMKNLANDKTEYLDLEGTTVLPGINDTHTHVNSIGTSGLDLRPPAVNAIADVVALTDIEAKKKPVGQWIRGSGWNHELFDECRNEPAREPNRWDLDKVSPDHPVIFTDFTYHNVWVNSKALELANIAKQTPDPEGGVIVRNSEGEPTGVLRENAAFMMSSVAPGLTRDEMKEALLIGIRFMNSDGVTSFTQPLFAPWEEEIDIYRELHAEGKLTARIINMPQFGSNFEELKTNLDRWRPPRGFDPDWTRFSQIKIFADGIGASRTAWMWKPYEGDDCGTMTIAADTIEEKYDHLQRMIRYGHEKGWQIGIHAVGDRTVSSVLDGYESALKDFPQSKNPRHYVIHADTITDADIQRAARLGVTISMQPAIQHMTADGVGNLLGPGRGERNWPFASVLKNGVNLTFSSDVPIAPPNWRFGIQAAITRKGVSGKVNGPNERVTREDAIRAYTINGAWQDHQETVKGSIEVGKFADFCVIDKDILSVPEEDIPDISVMKTIVNGQVVFEK